MLTTILTLAASLAILVPSSGMPRVATAVAPVSPAQCKRADRVINKSIRFMPGRTTTVVKDTVRLCTSHEYRLRARAGQTMSLNLATGNRTSMTVSAPSGDTLLDGGKDWSGELPANGEYTINIGTDATARYTLEVTIR